jgi:hypothetical protein
MRANKQKINHQRKNELKEPYSNTSRGIFCKGGKCFGCVTPTNNEQLIAAQKNS